jgi:NAD-dependent DNA ligase
MGFLSSLHNLKGGTWSERRIQTRHIDELIGMCRGVLLDGAVDSIEAEGLLRWLELNRDVIDVWPGSAIYARLADALSDGKLTADEERDVSLLLAQATGNPDTHDPLSNSPSSLPWDDPAPAVVHTGRQFCISGDFVRAQRHTIISMIEHRGGRYIDGVSGKTNYLIVGLNGSTEWKHGNFGTKIAKAIEFRSAGKPLCIVSEKHWIQCLDDAE